MPDQPSEDSPENPMREFSVREMRAGYQALTEALEQEGEVVLTHHGKPFARVLPIVDTSVRERLARRSRQLAEFRKTLPFQEVSSEQLVRQDRDGQ